MTRWLILLVVLLASPAEAQLWSSVLHPSRATDWTQAGVTGGIPNRTTICTTINPYGTVGSPQSGATITNAINACSASGGGVVKLAAGNFYLNDGIDFGSTLTPAHNVTLRGAGPDQTFINVSGYGPPCPQGGVICFQNRSMAGCGFFNYNGVGANIANWTAGYAPGTTVITLSTTTGGTNPLQVGGLIFLDQLNVPTSDFSLYVPFPLSDNTNTYANINNTTNGTPATGGFCQTGRNDGSRCVIEVHTVTAINGNQITISPPLSYHAWNSHGNDQPQALWCGGSSQFPVGDGVEDLSVMNVGITPGPGQAVHGLVQFFGAINSWMKNVRTSMGVNASVTVQYAANIEIRDSYMFGTTNASNCLIGATQYGFEVESGSFVKFENNIMQQMCTAIVPHACTACVFSYNMTIGDLPCGGQCNLFSWPIIAGHEGGDHDALYEGNISPAFSPDHNSGHGTNAGFVVAFRNYFYGKQNPTSTRYGIPFDAQAEERFSSAIGNVIGDPVHASLGWAYDSRANGTHNGTLTDGVLWSLGYSCQNNGVAQGCNNLDDAVTAGSFMRWCNFDYVTNTVRSVTSEVPSPGQGSYPQFIPAASPSCTGGALPSSFYLSARPSWFNGTGVLWPPIGPDVTTGTVDSAHHVANTPAWSCYFNVMRGSASGATETQALTFNANTCYGAGGADTTPPAAPTGVTIQ